MNGKTSCTLGGAVGILTLLVAVPAASAQDTGGARQDTSISQSASDSSAPANATSRIDQRERQDSMGRTGQNPPGYRGMERPSGLDSAAAANHDSTGKMRADKKSGRKHKHAVRTGQDSTKWGYKVDKNPKHQNPPGYRGMERPIPSDSRDTMRSSPQDSTSASQY